MANYLTIDGGTTNTRVSLVCEHRLLATKKMSIGAGNADVAALKSAVRTAIAQILSENGRTEQDICRIIASGMISSEYGLCDLPHTIAPVGIKELHETMYETVMADISPIPFVFIRGVKTNGAGLEDIDMMRGEETELVGMLIPQKESCLYILPGSHSKHISIDRDGRITALRTMMTGELFAAVMQNTILRDAADFDHNVICEEELLRGFFYAQTRGINEALFKTRILKNLFHATKEQCYSFLLGCVLCDEVNAIAASSETTVVLGGQKQFRMALSRLLREVSDKQVLLLSDEQVAGSVSLGAVRIFEACEKV